MNDITTLDCIKARAGSYESISLATEDVFLLLGQVATLEQEIKIISAKKEQLLSTTIQLWGFVKPHPDFAEYDTHQEIKGMVKKALENMQCT